jgi:hypothetical protein
VADQEGQDGAGLTVRGLALPPLLAGLLDTADINATACSRVSDFDGRPSACPRGVSTSAATLRPTGSSRSACRIARTSTLCAICSVRVDSRGAIAAKARCTSLAVSSVRFTEPSSSFNAFTIVPRYKSPGPRRQSVHAMRQPVLQRVTHRVALPRT